MCSTSTKRIGAAARYGTDRWRELMGATDYRKAAEGTIRREFATDIEKNVVHGSDAPETAAFEIGYFFNRFEILA